MTQPSIIGQRPAMPSAGAAAQEYLVARFRRHARGLFLSALVLIATTGAVGFFTDNVPFGYDNVALWAAAGAVVLLLVVVPFFAWLGVRYAVTSRRVIVSRGLVVRKRRELLHSRGYTMAIRRGPLQRLWGAGTLTLSNGVDEPIELRNVPNVRLVHEVLVDQVEINQILAHRDAQNNPYV